MDFLPLSNNLLAEATKQIIGERQINLFETFKTDSRNAGKKQRFKNFLSWGANAATDYLFSNFSEIVMGSLLTLYMFDWNQSDAQIQEQIKSNELSQIGALGRLSATGIVRMTAMGVTKKAKHRYPQLDPHTLANLDEENREEIVSGLRSAMMAMRSTMISNAFLSTYMSGRHLISRATGSGETSKSEPWILSDKIEKIAEDQKDPKIKAYLTGFINESEDAIFDLAFLACNTVQSTYELSRLATNAAQGPKRVVKFTMDKDNPEEYTWVYGPQQNVINAIETAKIEGAVIASKDVGQIVQVGLDSALKAQLNERLVTAYFYSGANGATTLPDGKRAQKAEMRIPRCKLSADWDKLKSVLTPFDGGNYKVICHLDDGHTLQGFFQTEAEGRTYLTNIANTLCEGDIVKFTTIEPNSDPKFKKEPARFTVSRAQYRIAKETTDPLKKNFVDSNGKYWKVKTLSLKLRATEKPDGIDAQILNPWAND
jgi:hypothetical protein